MKSKPKVVCSTCDGTGTVEIHECLFQTLNIVKKLGRATSWDVLKHKDFKDHIVPSAMSNRLEDLFKFGLLTRIRQGRAWLYSPK